MKSIESRFENWQKKRPNVGGIPNFARAVIGTKVARNTMRRAFNRLIDPLDYEGVSKNILLDWLDGLSKVPFAFTYRVNNRPSTTLKMQDKEQLA